MGEVNNDYVLKKSSLGPTVVTLFSWSAPSHEISSYPLGGKINEAKNTSTVIDKRFGTVFIQNLSSFFFSHGAMDMLKLTKEKVFCASTIPLQHYRIFS